MMHIAKQSRSAAAAKQTPQTTPSADIIYVYWKTIPLLYRIKNWISKSHIKYLSYNSNKLKDNDARYFLIYL